MMQEKRLVDAQTAVRSSRWTRLIQVLVLISFIFYCSRLHDAIFRPFPQRSNADGVVRTTTTKTEEMTQSLAECAWASLQPHVSMLQVAPIAREEFLRRQETLAAVLKEAGVDGCLAEPSASTAYYFNLSSRFELSERPFFTTFDADAGFGYLVPAFEASRIDGLDMIYRDSSSKAVIEWREEESPFEVFRNRTGFRRVMVDEQTRYMIAAGLERVGIQVVPMSLRVQSIRSVKSPAEIEILRAINRFTLQLVRSLQGCIAPGILQSTIVDAAQELFTRAGVGHGYWSIVLFGSQAASPHGGESGKTLRDDELVLIDIGSSLHDYGSDVTRTILPNTGSVSSRLKEMFRLVQASQTVAISLMNANQTCRAVDEASRSVFEEVGIPYGGYRRFFTHRLGHGLGLEMHEHPYLNGANEQPLEVGNVVTNEPGLYVTDAQAGEIELDHGFGIRTEDAILVTDGKAEILTGSQARDLYHP